MLRSDAQDNRDRVLEAARTLFAERGIDVTMRAVARRARVGPATLYRRFPTKQILIEEAFAGELDSCDRIVRDGHADADPWRGLCRVIEELSVLNVRNQGFVDAFTSMNPDLDVFAAHRAGLVEKLADLAGRAQTARKLRSDFVIDDLVLVLLANRGLAAAPPNERETAARRFAALAVQAFRATETETETEIEHELPPPPRLVMRPQPERMRAAGPRGSDEGAATRTKTTYAVHPESELPAEPIAPASARRTRRRE